MFNGRSKPETHEVARPQVSKNLHASPRSGRSYTSAVKARPDVVRIDAALQNQRARNLIPLTAEQQKLVEDMETRWVDLDWHQPQTHLKRPVLEVPKVVFEEAYRYGPPTAGAQPRHPRYVDMLLAGTEAVTRAARTFNPEFGDGKMDFAEYARRGVRHVVAEQLSDRLVHVPRKRQKEWPRERRIAVDSWDGLAESVTDKEALRAAMAKHALGDDSFGDEGNEFTLHESRTETRSRWAEKFEQARALELRAPTEEDIEALEVDQETALALMHERAEGVLSVWGLTPREQRALILRYGLNGANLGTDPSFAEIGTAMGVSGERARQLVRNGERRLKDRSPDARGAPRLPVWSQHRGRSYGKERQRPAWEDDVLARVDRDSASTRAHKTRRRARKRARVRAAASSREQRGKPESVRRPGQRFAESSVELKEAA